MDLLRQPYHVGARLKMEVPPRWAKSFCFSAQSSWKAGSER